MASGLATLRTLKQTNPYPYLEAFTQKLVAGLSERATQAGLPHTIPQIGSMFTLFFNPEVVTNYTAAVKSDTQRFARYFHAMLGRGVYLACSQYEANFVSAAHVEADLQATLSAAEAAFAAIKTA
jgi:glutamate-1-semialdehyde 2,1-aminomutase